MYALSSLEVFRCLSKKKKDEVCTKMGIGFLRFECIYPKVMYGQFLY